LEVEVVVNETCSVLSRERREPIAGTAVSQTVVWIVLEHNGPWGAKALVESDLPPAVKERLLGWEASIEGARIQLVRRNGAADGTIRLWLGHSGLGRERLVHWVLEAVEHVLELDLPALAAALARGEAVEGARVCDRPLVLVCTNGRRDRCCAKLGVAVARALSEQGLDVWQTTHLGGHRFAPTLLQLPAGLCYGRVELDEIPGLAAAISSGRIFRLDRLRGRTALTEAEQAAESEWRARTGAEGIDDLVAAEHVERNGEVLVTLRDHHGIERSFTLQRRKTGVSAPPSCGKPEVDVEAWTVLDR
jgi:hypothetical protein